MASNSSPSSLLLSALGGHHLTVSSRPRAETPQVYRQLERTTQVLQNICHLVALLVELGKRLRRDVGHIGIGIICGSRCAKCREKTWSTADWTKWVAGRCVSLLSLKLVDNSAEEITLFFELVLLGLDVSVLFLER
jgi:hypothetical protein